MFKLVTVCRRAAWALQTFFSRSTQYSRFCCVTVCGIRPLYASGFVGGDEVFRPLQKTKQASSPSLCPQFSPAYRRTTCAGLFYIVFMALLSLVRRRHYYRQPVPHLMATQVYSPVCGLYVTVTSYPFSVIASTHAYASAFFFVLKVTTSFAILYWIVSVFLDTVT